MSKLYHYVHCPFCVRVRMGLGLLNKNYDSVVLAYDDEQTPIALTGVKMLPIFKEEGGSAQNESLDILRTLDGQNILNFTHLKKRSQEVDVLLDKIAAPVHNLAMPYWIWTPEFDSKSRTYFQAKKEKKRGPFHLLVGKKEQFLKELSPIFNELQAKLSPFYESSTLTIVDLMIAAHLWGLYIVPEVQLPSEIHNYLMKVKELCRFDYHQDFWRGPDFSALRSPKI